MDIVVREATPEDAEDMLAFMDLLLSEPGLDIPLERDEFDISLEEEARIMAEYAASDNAIFLLAMCGGELVGQLNIKGGTHRALRHGATLGLAVKIGWRGRGVGSALMRRAMEWAQAGGVLNRIELSVYVRNQPAIHLYEKFAFKVEGLRQKVIYQDGEYLDDLIMARLF
jgi:RimJ/RimL family protein N-acetyltransferase